MRVFLPHLGGFASLAAAAAILFSAAGAAAQIPPAAAPGTVEERVRPSVPVAPLAIPPEELQLTGHEDLIVLTQRKLFDLHADTGYQYTDNAFFSNQAKSADHIFTGSVAARAATQIAETYDVFAEADLFTNRYTRHSVLDYDGVSGVIGGAVPLPDDFRLTASYTGTDSTTSGFDRHLLTLNDLNLTLLRPVFLSNDTSLTASLGVTRSYAVPADFDSWAVNLGASGIYVVVPGISLYASPTVYYKNYDDYFQRVTGVTREDRGVAMSLGLTWTPAPPVLVTAQISGTYNYSTVHFNLYTAFVASPTLRLGIAF